MQTPVQKFTEALENWQEANRDYHRRKAELIAQGSYSIDYYLHHERCRQEDATRLMQVAFEEAVVAAVQKAVEAR